MPQVKPGIRDKVKVIGAGASPPPPAPAPPLFSLQSLLQGEGVHSGTGSAVDAAVPSMALPPQYFTPPFMQSAPSGAEAQGAASEPVTSAPPPVASGGNSDSDNSAGKAMNILSLAGILPLLAGKYGAELIPSIAGSAIQGDMAHRQAVAQAEQLKAAAALAAIKANNEISLSQRKQALSEQSQAFQQGLGTREQNFKETDADRQFGIAQGRDTRESEAQKAKVQGEWEDRFRGLTPESAQALYNGLPDDFKKAYGIVLPQGGLEARNPNAKSAKELSHDRMKDIGQQLLSPGAERLDPETQVGLMQQYNTEAKIAGEPTIPEKPLAALTAKEKADAEIKIANALTARHAQEATAQHQAAALSETRRHNVSSESIARSNAQTASINAQTSRARLDMDKQLKAANSDPHKALDAVGKEIDAEISRVNEITKKDPDKSYSASDIARMSATLHQVNEHMARLAYQRNLLEDKAGVPRSAMPIPLLVTGSGLIHGTPLLSPPPAPAPVGVRAKLGKPANGKRPVSDTGRSTDSLLKELGTLIK